MSIRIAYTTYYDPNDVTRWSGLGTHMHRALSGAGAAVSLIGPLRPQYHPVNIGRHVWNARVLGKNDHPHRDAGFLRHYARQVERRLRLLDGAGGYDVVVGAGGLPLCHLETDRPVVVWTDCTFATLLDYYDAFTGMSARSIRDGHEADRALYRRVWGGMFASAWASQSAVRDYGLDPERAVVTGLGANLPGTRDEATIERLIAERRRAGPRLLFIGVDWARKRGDLAVEATAELRRRGLDATLDAVGGRPGGGVPEWVRVHGFVSKATPGGVRTLVDLFERASFFVLPTRAEAYGVVFCEASGAGVPSLSCRTGGVPEAVCEGVNGVLLDPDADAIAWADAIEEAWRDAGRYADLARSSFAEYRAHLSWDAIGVRAMAFLERAAATARAPRREVNAPRPAPEARPA